MTPALTEMLYRTGDIASQITLIVICVVAFIVGAPILMVVRIAVMLDNISLGLPANYGLKRHHAS